MTDPAAHAGPVWLDGALRQPEEATLPYDDHGVTVGDGVFETILVRHGIPFALDAHLDRLERSGHILGLSTPSRAEVERAIGEVCAANDVSSTRFLRVTVTAGVGPLGSPRSESASPATSGPTPRLIVALRDGRVRTEPTAAALGPWRRNEHSAIAGAKSTSYAENVVALASGHKLGCSETLFLNGAGRLCEGTGSNVVVSLDGRLVTPPLSSGCLAGVTRALCLRLVAHGGPPIEELDVDGDDLHRIDGMALVSTGREVQPVHTIRRFGPNIGAPPDDRGIDPEAPAIAALRAAWLSYYGPAD